MSERGGQVTHETGATFAVTRIDGDQATFVVAGRFDVLDAMPARERLAEPDIAAVDHLTIDLRGVTFIDSAGLAVLARQRRDRALRGGTVTLIRPFSEEAMRVFRLTQFDEIFTMIDSPEGSEE